MHNPIMAPERRPVLVDDGPVTAPVCDSCGETLAPDGACLELGTCARADQLATRGAGRVTSKYAVPAAWNARGYVD